MSGLPFGKNETKLSPIGNIHRGYSNLAINISANTDYIQNHTTLKTDNKKKSHTATYRDSTAIKLVDLGYEKMPSINIGKRSRLCPKGKNAGKKIITLIFNLSCESQNQGKNTDNPLPQDTGLKKNNVSVLLILYFILSLSLHLSSELARFK